MGQTTRGLINFGYERETDDELTAIYGFGTIDFN